MPTVQNVTLSIVKHPDTQTDTSQAYLKVNAQLTFSDDELGKSFIVMVDLYGEDNPRLESDDNPFKPTSPTITPFLVPLQYLYSFVFQNVLEGNPLPQVIPYRIIKVDNLVIPLEIENPIEWKRLDEDPDKIEFSVPVIDANAGGSIKIHWKTVYFARTDELVAVIRVIPSSGMIQSRSNIVRVTI